MMNNSMKKIIVNDEVELSQVVSDLIVRQIEEKSDSVLGLATGKSPERTYEKLVQYYKDSKVSFKSVKTFNLDEYVGVHVESHESYHYFMANHLFNHIDIKSENTHLPNPMMPLEACCEAYETLLAQQPIDLQLLGLGTNGHIGFNEPYVDFNLGVHVIELSEQTRQDNLKYFQDHSEMPTHAVTMGIRNIMNAKKVILIVNNEKKKAAYDALMSGVITSEWPVTALINHPDLTVVAVKSVVGN